MTEDVVLIPTLNQKIVVLLSYKQGLFGAKSFNSCALVHSGAMATCFSED